MKIKFVYSHNVNLTYVTIKIGWIPLPCIYEQAVSNVEPQSLLIKLCNKRKTNNHEPTLIELYLKLLDK